MNVIILDISSRCCCCYSVKR